jgi:Helix-turn-helix domain of transposase family ISL3/zinc-finger of transposase IS204/IS1001/IS1096/IS1165
MGWYDRKIRQVRDLSCGDNRILLELEVRRVDCRSCGKVKQERLDFLADNPFYTKRFAYFVGRRCRQASISDVAKELALDWHTVKALEMQYMKTQLARAGTPGPLVIGIDEIAIRKGLVSRASPVHAAMRNCTGDEGGPFGVGNQVLISSHRKLLRSKAVVVNVAETSGQDSGRHGRERRA